MTNRKLMCCAFLAVFISFFAATALFGAARPAAPAAAAAGDQDNDLITLQIKYMNRTLTIPDLGPTRTILDVKKRIQALTGFEVCFQKLDKVTYKKRTGASPSRRMLGDDETMSDLGLPFPGNVSIELAYFGDPATYSLFVVLPHYQILACGGMTEADVDSIKQHILQYCPDKFGPEIHKRFAESQAMFAEMRTRLTEAQIEHIYGDEEEDDPLPLYTLQGRKLIDGEEELVEDEDGAPVGRFECISTYKFDPTLEPSILEKCRKVYEADAQCFKLYELLYSLKSKSAGDLPTIARLIDSFVHIPQEHLSVFGKIRYAELCKGFVPLLSDFVRAPQNAEHIPEISRRLYTNPTLKRFLDLITYAFLRSLPVIHALKPE